MFVERSRRIVLSERLVILAENVCSARAALGIRSRRPICVTHGAWLLVLCCSSGCGPCRPSLPRVARSQQSFEPSPWLQRLLDAGGLVNANAQNLDGTKETDIEFTKKEITREMFADIGAGHGPVSASFRQCEFATAALGGLEGARAQVSLTFDRCRLAQGAIGPLDGASAVWCLAFVATPLDDESFSEVTRLPNLRALCVFEAPLSDAGLRLLSECPNLSTLILRDTHVDDDFVRHIVDGHRDLIELDVRGSRVTDASLASVGQLPNLRRLGVGRCQITDAGLEKLVGLIKLEGIDLSGTLITDDGLRSLSGFSELNTLGLADTAVTDAGMNHLSVLRKLKDLAATGTQITAAAARRAIAPWGYFDVGPSKTGGRKRDR